MEAPIEGPAKNPFPVPRLGGAMSEEHKPVGPYAPPRPSEAEREQGEPMAVANDKATRHGESFLPTTADLDQFDADVARRYKQVREGTVGDAITRSREENRRQEEPAGYSETDARGWRHLEEEE